MLTRLTQTLMRERRWGRKEIIGWRWRVRQIPSIRLLAASHSTCRLGKTHKHPCFSSTHMKVKYQVYTALNTKPNFLYKCSKLYFTVPVHVPLILVHIFIICKNTFWILSISVGLYFFILLKLHCYIWQVSVLLHSLNFLFWSEGHEFKPQYYQAATVGPLGKGLNPQLLRCLNEINVRRVCQTAWM